MTDSQKDQVHLLTGAKVEITQIGEGYIFENEVVKNALFVPDFKLNLLSVSKITRELSYLYHSIMTFVYFKTSSAAG